MKFLDQVKDRVVGALAGFGIGADRLRATEAMADTVTHEPAIDKIAREGMAELELMVEDMGWRELNGQSAFQFTRAAIKKMVALSRLMFLMNPLIKRSVRVQELYVWGSGYEIKSEDPDVNQVLKDFFEHPKNQVIIGPGPTGWAERERDQRNDGNNFFAFFVNKATGACRLRLIPLDEVEEIICNPEDTKEVWFYRRTMPKYEGSRDVTSSRLYPDILYDPRTKPASINNVPVNWDVRVLHVKTGGLSTMYFGMPEIFSGLNWARAYKGILENFATILNAYARVALQITGNKNKKDVAAAKSKLNTGSVGGSTDTNPPTNTASWFLSSGGMQISAVKTAHSTTGPDEARALRSMVASAADTPEHFFGDSDIGNLATSETLDRPTELNMISRQSMWAAVIVKMGQYVIIQSTQAANGKLRKAGFKIVKERDDFDGQVYTMVLPPAGKDRTTTIKMEFPNIIDRDIVDKVRSVVQALTLNGNKAEGIIPNRKIACHMLLKALGIKNVDEVVDKLYPENVTQGFADPAISQEIEMKKAAQPKPVPAKV